jgi:hypothetical protein
MKTDSTLTLLLQQSEAALATLREQRAQIEKAERTATERVAHLRALIDLERGDESAERTTPRPTAVTAPLANGQRRDIAVPVNTSTMRIEDIAAEILSDRGPLHYRELWEAAALRGAATSSADPAAVLLTRISRDDRFARAGRGMYALASPDQPRVKPRKHRRRRSRRTVKKPTTISEQT